MEDKIDLKYIHVLISVIETILKRVTEMGLERKDKEQTVALMKKLVNQTNQRHKKKPKPEDLPPEEHSKTDLGQPGDIDLKYLHEGFFEDHWLMSSTILSIAQLQFLTPDDILFTLTDINEEVCPEVTMEKIALLAVCFYAISTEYRFKEKLDEVKEQADKKALVQKETTVIAPRFRDFDLHKKLADADSAFKARKGTGRAPEVKNTVPPS